jgi:putative hydrolase of the HAD superfamily
MPDTEAILFDLDGTLLALERSYSELLAETFRAVEGKSRETWVEQYSEAFADLFGRVEQDPVERAFASIEACTEPEALAEELHRRETAACRPPDGTHETLERLAERYALGVLTNGMPGWQRHKLREAGLDRHIEAVVTSYEAGAHKPDTAPYRLAEQRLPAERYAMVGDSASDIEGAENAGWAACRYTGDGFDELPEAIDWA